MEQKSSWSDVPGATGISYRPIHLPQSQHAPHAPLVFFLPRVDHWVKPRQPYPTRDAPEPDPWSTLFVLYSGLKKKIKSNFKF